MPFVGKTWHWQSLWWFTVAAIAVFMKHHYSVAIATELEWIFHPLAMLLELFTGHAFQQDNYGEWVSYSANVRLVKACAGINFMIMSFIVYSWVFRPDKQENTNNLSHLLGQLLLISAAIIAAWATCLLANSLRIIIAMEAASQHWELPSIGIDTKQLHRLIGMFIYIPLLSLQMTLGETNKKHSRALFIGPLLLYLIMIVFVPLLTGNALQHPKVFLEHVLFFVGTATCITTIFFIALGLKRFLCRTSTKMPNQSHL